MGKKEKNKIKKTKKWQRLMVVTGSIFMLTLSTGVLTGCASQTSAPAQTTEVETTEDEHRFDVNIPLTGEDATKSTKEVVETVPGGGEVGVTADGETVHDMGRYGELGKEFFETNVLTNWKNYTIPDEQTLRERMDTVYGDLSTKEDLIQEVLATPRDPQPTQSAETQAAETQPQGGSTNNGGNSNTTTPKETKATTPKETKSNTTATQAPAVDPSKKAEVDAKIKEWENTPAHVDDQGGAGGINEGAEDAAKGWQWQ